MQTFYSDVNSITITFFFVSALSSLDAFYDIYDWLGNPTHPMLAPDVLFKIDSTSKVMSLTEKVESLTYSIIYRSFYYWYYLPTCETIADKYFPKDITPLRDVMSSTSLLITNRNPIMHPVKPNVPNIVSVGQIHLKPSKTLPVDIQNFLNSSSKGAVYISFGTSVSHIKKHTVDAIFETFSELPYNIIFKWETDNIPNKPKNLLIKQWVPQQDLLGKLAIGYSYSFLWFIDLHIYDRCTF